MNNYANTASNAALLKDYYGPISGPDPLTMALRNRRKKMMENRGMLEPQLNSETPLTDDTGLIKKQGM